MPSHVHVDENYHIKRSGNQLALHIHIYMLPFGFRPKVGKRPLKIGLTGNNHFN